MDGQRARRLKCGSPIGRIIDEAGDPFIYTWITHMIGYVLKINTGFLVAPLIYANVTSHVIEIKYIQTGKHDYMSDMDDIGP